MGAAGSCGRFRSGACSGDGGGNRASWGLRRGRWVALLGSILADFCSFGRAPSQAAGRPVWTDGARRAVRVARAGKSSLVATLGRQTCGHLQVPLVALGAGVAAQGAVSALAAGACGDGASRATRISPRRRVRQRLARKPKWRTRMKPLGRTWSRKRRTSSSRVSASGRLPRTRAVAGSVGIRCTRKSCRKP